jgi:hypothetical protein
VARPRNALFFTLERLLKRAWIRLAARSASAQHIRTERESKALARYAGTKASVTIDNISPQDYAERLRADTAAEFRKDLAYTAATLKPLMPQERLWILTELGEVGSINPRVVADIYMACGCRHKAATVFKKIGH